MTVAWRARTLEQPAYRPDLDLLAIAPAGAPLVPEPAPMKRSLGARHPESRIAHCQRPSDVL